MSESGPDSGAAGTNRRSDRPSGVPPVLPGEADQDEDQRSTTALPRPAGPPPTPPFDSRYSSAGAQPTTALPRTPPGPRYPAIGYDSDRNPGAGYRGPNYSDPDHRGQDHRGQGSSGQGSSGQSYRGQGNSGQSYRGQEPSGQGYRDARPSGSGDRGYQRFEPRADQAPAGPSWAPQQHSAPASTPSRRSDQDQDQDQGQDRPEYQGQQDSRDHRHPAGSRPADQYPHDHYPHDQNLYDQHPYDQNPYDQDPPASRRPPPRGSHLPPYSEPLAAPTAPAAATPPGMRSPRKLTVTRVAALRSRELTSRGVQMFHRATTADGADKSGLTSLTYAVMANYAVDAALAVALAGTLFFAAATAESTGRVLLYLVITVAPFAVIAPFIGPMLDRLQSGRRLALAVSSFGRALLAILMAFNFSHFNPWVIYPCALGNLVLSKAFGVLKAALTPRVLPAQITLVKTNSRLTTFGMIAGGVAGALAAGLSKIAGSPGALFFTAACAVAGGVLCLRIPAWVESTEGEVPVKGVGASPRKKGFPQIVTATLWANSMIRVETGFLALFIAFVVKSQYPAPQHSAFTQLLLLGVVGGAAGVGGFVGNTMGARLTLSAPETISIFALVSVLVSTIVAVLVPGLATAAIVGFVGSTASALAKVSLDSVIQHHLPEESRASAFGKSESVLQLGWVFGGVVGLLLGGVWTFGHDSVYAIGFGTITVLLAVGLVQCYLVRSGRTMVPKLRPRAGRGVRSSVRRTADASSGTGRRTETTPRADTDRLARPAPGTTAQLPAVEAPAPRRRPRKAGDDR